MMENKNDDEFIKKYLKYKAQCEKQKGYIKKYHLSEKGKQKRREAQRRYYAKMKAKKQLEKEKINSNIINKDALPNKEGEK